MIQERSISISTRTIVKIIVTLLVLAFLWAVRDTVALVFTALILAAVMMPLAQWGRRYKIPKGLSVIVFYLLFFGGFTWAFILVIPELIRQAGSMAGTIGQSWQVLSTGVDWLRDFSQAHGLSQNLEAGVTSLQDQVTSVVSSLFTTLSGIFGGIVGLSLVLVLAFYMVVQEEEALRWFKNFLPDEHQQFVTRLLKEVQTKFGHWLLGQLALSVIIGVLYYIGLRLLGVEGALVLAILGAFTEFIPYLGPILGGIPAVLVATSQSPTLGLLTLLLYVVIQQLENQIIVPKIMEKAVGISPVVSIVALLVGAELFGVPGAILAIPVATALSVGAMELWKYQRKEG